MAGRTYWLIAPLLAVACGGSVVSTGEPDGSGQEDAGGLVDAGGQADGGDAGRTRDGGNVDAGHADGGSVDAGPVANWNGIGNILDGGQLASLDFGDVGDTRPAFYDFPYPSQIIGTIYADIAALSPPVFFVVSTGDYMFADPTDLLGNDAATQAALYVDAGRIFPGPVLPSMGNHECDWATSGDNCFGQTSNPNFNAFLQVVLGGFGLPDRNPYYAVVYASADPTNPWTAKFIYTAPNWWDTTNDTQQTWVQDVLAQPTTYTFVVRHEPTSNSGGAAGVAPIDTLLQTYSFTLKLTGHSHSYSYDQTNREIINGLGGAALDLGYSGTYGYVVCRQRADMAIQCTLFDYDSNAVSSEPNATIAVEPDGTPTAPN